MWLISRRNKDKLSIRCKLQLFGICIYIPLARLCIDIPWYIILQVITWEKKNMPQWFFLCLTDICIPYFAITNLIYTSMQFRSWLVLKKYTYIKTSNWFLLLSFFLVISHLKIHKVLIRSEARYKFVCSFSHSEVIIFACFGLKLL